jgi:predicted DsbA family dithiol-disulfide isomerase
MKYHRTYLGKQRCFISTSCISFPISPPLGVNQLSIYDLSSNSHNPFPKAYPTASALRASHFLLWKYMPCKYLTWHYNRLDKSLAKYRSDNPNSSVNFTVQLLPYQLYPAMAATGEPNREWQTQRKYYGDTTKFDVFELTMNEYAEPLGFKFKWDGEIANTLEAHRVIQVFQGGEEFDDITDSSGTRFGKKYGPSVAAKVLDTLYRAFFLESKHPSAEDTLLDACKEAGVEDADARRVVVDEKDLGAPETKCTIQLVGMNGETRCQRSYLKAGGETLPWWGRRRLRSTKRLSRLLSRGAHRSGTMQDSPGRGDGQIGTAGLPFRFDRRSICEKIMERRLYIPPIVRAFTTMHASNRHNGTVGSRVDRVSQVYD